MAQEVKVQSWTGKEPPSIQTIRELLAEDGLDAYRWANRPGDIYGAHDHPYHKVIYVIEGSITFGLPSSGEEVVLQAGDRLDLPAGVRHDAVVGPRGVVCLEAHC